MEEKRPDEPFVPDVAETSPDEHSPVAIAEHVVAAFMSQSTSNPIAEKMTPENIDHFMETKVKIATISMVAKLASAALAVIGVIVIIVLLRSYDVDAMSEIIKTLLTAAVAFAGGYGFGKSRNDD